MISLVAQCGKCGVRWATGVVRNVVDLGHAAALLAKSIEQGAPICIDCSGGTASDKEVQQHRRAVELAKGTNLPECPYCETKGSEIVLDEGAEEGAFCCDEGAELGWWDLTALRWHRSTLEEQPS